MRLKPTVAIIAASIAALAVRTQQASAVYLGLGLQLHTTVNINGTDRSVWRLYAVFDNPTNYAVYGAGTENLGPLTIQSRNFNDTAPGSNFYQNAAGGNLAPTQAAIAKVPDAQWDTFATIGVAVNDGTDGTVTAPGFPTFINGNSLSGEMAWNTLGPVSQGQAANGLSGVFINGGSSLSGLGVLLAQLTVNAGGNVRGTLAVGVNTTLGAPSFAVPNQTFNSVPAPGALALLAIAALRPRARRRNM